MTTITDILMNINNIQDRKYNMETLFNSVSGNDKPTINITFSEYSLQKNNFKIIKENIAKQLSSIANISDCDYCPKIRLMDFSDLYSISAKIPKIEQALIICIGDNVPSNASAIITKIIKHVPPKSPNVSYNENDLIEDDIKKWIRGLPLKNEKIKVKIICNYRNRLDYCKKMCIPPITKQLENFVEFVEICDDCPIIRLIDLGGITTMDDFKKFYSDIGEKEQSIFIVERRFSIIDYISGNFGFPIENENILRKEGHYQKMYIYQNNELPESDIAKIRSWLNYVQMLRTQKRTISILYDQININTQNFQKIENNLRNKLRDIAIIDNNCANCPKIRFLDHNELFELSNPDDTKITYSLRDIPRFEQSIFMYVDKKDPGILPGLKTLDFYCFPDGKKNSKKIMYHHVKDYETDDFTESEINQIKKWIHALPIINKKINVQIINNCRGFERAAFDIISDAIKKKLTNIANFIDDCNDCPKIRIFSCDTLQKIGEVYSSIPKNEQSIFVYFAYPDTGCDEKKMPTNYGFLLDNQNKLNAKIIYQKIYGPNSPTQFNLTFYNISEIISWLNHSQTLQKD